MQWLSVRVDRRPRPPIPIIAYKDTAPAARPNLLIDRVITAPRQVWVSDITYLYIGLGFGYLSLVTAAYSKLIVGYCLHPFLTAEESLKALDMALSTHLEREEELIHHRSGDPVRSRQPIL